MTSSRLHVLGRALVLLVLGAAPGLAAPAEPPILAFPPVDADALIARDAGRGPGGPLQFAEPIEVLVTPQTDGRWDTLADGSRTWRLGIQVPAATDLNFGFAEFLVPEGATLTIADRNRETMLTHRAGDGAAGQLWTAVVPGDFATIELALPAGAPDPALELSQVGAGYRDFLRRQDPVALAGACHVDVACPEGLPWREEARSAIKYSIGGTETCSGTLIADVPRSWRPFILSANHCDVTAANAPTIVAYWNFQASTCLGPRDGAANDVTQSGATFRAALRDTDMALFELAAPPVAGSNAWWAGWDRSTAPAPSSAAIHHPNLDEKSISFDRDPLYAGENCIEPGLFPDTHWYVGAYEQGSTEYGSSGSGIFDEVTHRLVGTLSGGYAWCGILDYDCWGRFDRHWGAGATAAQRLSDWLDPAGTGAMSVPGGEPPAAASITLDHADDFDACALGLGDGNGIVEPGEAITIVPWLTASGGDFTVVRATLDTGSPWASLTDASATWPDLPAGTTAGSDAPHLRLAVDPAAPCGTTIDLTLRVLATGGGPFDLPLSLTVGGATSSPVVPVAIPDLGTGRSDLVITTDVTLASVAVRVQVAHSYVGDLVLELQSPGGRIVTLLDRPGHPMVGGGCDAADFDVTFRDGSPVDLESTCTTTSPWYEGEAAPVQALSAYAGERSAGTWTLIARDASEFDAGQITDWELLATPFLGECTACADCPGQRIAETPADAIRVSKGAGSSLILTIPGPASSCASGIQVRRSTIVRPAAGVGSFPTDPPFSNVTAQDLEPGPEFRHVPPAGTVFYLVVEDLGGAPGPSGSYGY